MKPKTIYLIRHAKPVLKDNQPYYLGESDPPLSAEGLIQAEHLSCSLQDRPVRAIYCSDLARAVQTAKIIAERQQCRPVILKGLREINLGKWEGLSREEVEKLFPGEYARRGKDIVHYRPPGGESFNDVRKRVIPVFRRLVEQTEGDMAIVAHAGVNRVILCELMQIDLKNLFLIEQDYACITIIQKDESGYSVGGKMKIYEQGDLEPITGETLRPGGLELTEEALDFCRFSQGANILDVGCGSGATVRYLIEQHSLNAIGVDISQAMIDKGKKISPELPLLKGSGDNLPLRGNTMDGILMECSFSLIEDADFALTESYRVLKEGGRLIISDFYYRNRPGIKTKEAYLAMMEEHEFEVELWRDKSHYLGQLVVDCIMREHPEDILWQCLLSKEENRGLTREQVKAFKPGYFLLIARKQVKTHEAHDHEHFAAHGECSGMCGKDEEEE